jgi:hypothetical protein
MPIGEAHHRQKQKNYALLIALLALMALLFAITVMRLGS